MKRYADPTMQFTGVAIALMMSAVLIPEKIEAQPQANTLNLDTALTGTNGTRILGNLAQGRVGFAITGIGDVNGDGWADFAIGVAAKRDPDQVEGEVYLIFGNGERLPDNLSLDEYVARGRATRIVAGAFEPEEWQAEIGRMIVPLGDIDGDGFSDFFIGSSNGLFAFEDFSSYALDYNFVVYGRGDWPTQIDLSEAGAGIPGVSRMIAEGLTVFGFGTETPTNYLGSSAVGDVDGDGLDDFVLVGITTLRDDTTTFPVTALIYGSTTRLPNNFSVINLPEDRRRFLPSLRGAAAVGDVDGDGYDDFVLYLNDSEFVGGSSLVFGGPDFRTTDLQLVSLIKSGLPEIGVLPYGIEKAAGLGDVNGDGYKDFMVGSLFTRECYVVYGGPQLRGVEELDLSSHIGSQTTSNGFRLALSGGQDFVPMYMAGVGDFNGDGFSDVFLNRIDNTSPFDSRFIMMIRGRSNPFGVVAMFNDSLSLGQRFEGRRSNGYLANARLVGDLDGDGLADVISGAPQATINSAPNAGQAYVVYGYDRRLSAGAYQASGTWTHFLRPGDSRRQPIGTVGSRASVDPESRLWIRYLDGAGPEGKLSTLKVTLRRNRNLLTGLTEFDLVAPVHWEVDSNRTNTATASVTIRYTPMELSGIDLESARVLVSTTDFGPWSLAPNLTHLPEQRRFTFSLPIGARHIAIVGGEAPIDIASPSGFTLY